MAEKFDVFISYRRQGGRDIARILQLQLAQRGLRCFFDFDELQNGDFNEAIYESIKSSKNFIVILSSGALERCINDGDWVRREIECALQNKINVVPVAPNDAPRAFPGKLPESLECLRKLQIAPLNMEDLLDASVDKIIRKNLVGIEIDSATGKVKGFNGAAKVSDEALLDLPKLGKAVPDVDLAVLDDSDKRTFKKAIRLYQTLRSRSALAEFRKIKNQDDPIVRYFVMRLAYEFEPDVDDAEFEKVCIRARDLGSSDAMIVFAERNLNSESEFGIVPYGECVAWFRKAISSGNPYAYVELAHAYEKGKGVHRNRRAAHQLYEKSAAANCIGGHVSLGLDYALGSNVRENTLKAEEELLPVLRHLSAIREDLTGSDLSIMALCYLVGIGGDRDCKSAIEVCGTIRHFTGNCATKALDYQNYALYLHALALMFDLSKGREISKADKNLAFDLLRQVCAHPHHSTVDAPWMLGICYENGIGTAIDLECAFKNYKLAAEHGDENAMESLAVMYLNDGSKKDVSKAKRLLEESASYGNVSAQCSLGTRYMEGAFGEPEVEKAIEWWLKAAEGGDSDAMDNLGQCYRDGIGGIEINHKKAVEWFEKGAEAGNANSLENLGMAYLAGEGLGENKAEAERLLLKAVELGNASAECTLGTRYYNGDFGVKDFEKAIKYWTMSAEHGDTTAMRNLGQVFRDGDAGVEKDLKKSIDWYEKARDAGDASAANALGTIFYSGESGDEDKVRAFNLQLESARSGDADGMFNVAGLYREGEGVERNMVEAFFWYKQGAKAGNPDAMVQVGFAYLNGAGVEEDKGEAEKWFLKAAETGDVDAENTLGVRYYNGDFGKPDFKKALEWIRKSAIDGHPNAMNNLGQLYRDGDADLAIDDRQAVKWFRKAANIGFADAMINLGFAYLYGKGVVENVGEAEKWFIKGAETGDADAECSIGTRYAQGAFGEKNYAKAVEWWLKAAEHGDSAAMGNLAACYRDGDLGEKNLAKAEEWYLRASEAGNADATCSLAMCYYRGDFGKEDKKKAYDWSLKAAELGDGVAMYNLGCMYQNADGVDKDMDKAISWFKNASERGIASAMRDLGFIYLQGDGVVADREAAEKWFIQAAETGDAGAECCLGTRYADGDFENVDNEKAIQWWQTAARHGEVDALANLGRAYIDGDVGQKKDCRRGFALVKEAAEAGNPIAMERLGIAYMNGEGVVVDEQKAREWMTKAAEAGNAHAEYDLGAWLANGKFGEKDIELAVQKLENAASHGAVQALVLLGRIFGDPEYADNDTRLDLKRAVDYFMKADEAGHDEAAVWLGVNTLGLLGARVGGYDDVQKKFECCGGTESERSRILRKARSWFRRAVDNNSGDRDVVGAALRWLARIARYENDLTEAIRLYRQAIEHGDDASRNEVQGLDAGAGTHDASPHVPCDASSSAKKAEEKHEVDSGRSDADHNEAAFVHKALRYLRRGEGDLSVADEEKLETLAKDFGIDAVRFEDLIAKAEDEYKNVKP